MTCRGYDSRAVKVGKPVKVLAAQILDNHVRGAFVRSYVSIAIEASKFKSSRRDKK